ncbi:MAG: hypothetical protein JW768_13105 [Chitinispirillaceae bacterium]|nr:hypothetical protein [Chitinispirillaceae bacterium]
MKFKLNLIRELLAEQRAREAVRRKVAALVAVCYSLLGIILVYGIFQTFMMRSMVIDERTRLAVVTEEYQHYKATEMIVSKADVELLDRLQRSRIFWTKKLLAMANYLPGNYWITEFGYDRTAFGVDGYGYISEKQEQLITLHDYLDGLRKEPTFNDVFPSIYLNSTIRKDDKQNRRRVSFSYSCIGGTP